MERISEQQFFDEQYKKITKDGRLLYVGRILERGAQEFGTLPALIYKDEIISYQNLYNRAAALTQLLKKLEVQPRDRVIICFDNSPEFFIAYYAVLQAGAIVAPVNTFLKEHELNHIVNDADARLIITSPDRVDSFEHAKVAKSQRGHQLHILTSDDFPQPGANFVPDEPIDLEMDEIAALLYTSGTTGLPKGVMLSSKNIMTNILQGLSRFQIGYQERIFGVLPLFHVFAQMVCVWIALYLGATVIVVAKIDRRYILSALKHQPTGFFGIPALYGLLCLLKTAPLDSVKYFISGGDALPDKIRAYFALLYRRKICNGYGLTETSPLIAVDFDDVAEPTNTVGAPVVGVAVEIRDEQGNVLPRGQIGELWVKGDNIMLGYYNTPDQTAKVLQDGWFKTGDTMYIDERGKLVIAGRVKDLIIHKGINIYPQEIENVIMSHPNVIRVGVIGLKDNAVGEIPIAYVQLRQEQEGIEEKLRSLCMQQLATYKVPRDFICTVEELPVMATGKVDKKVLRKKMAEQNQQSE
jgi:long-chain acyl-CoA synthetase